MKNYSGIDEAGLGPILGPYCATSTTFLSNEPLKELFQDQQKKLFYVDDSKKVYQGKHGLSKLELNVLSFYTLLKGEIPKTTSEFIPSLKSEWNLKEDLELPLITDKDLIYQKADAINKLFNKRGVKLIDIKRTAVSPKNFNILLDDLSNKSVVCQKIIEPLIYSVINGDSNHNIVIDKQGGRKFYKEYLDSITMESVDIIKEENNHSHYRLGNVDIHFMAKADSSSFPVALSSMFSKYMREISMMSFNSYWEKIIPGIKRTAGYYTDGIRFIGDIKSSNKLPIDPDTLIRKK